MVTNNSKNQPTGASGKVMQAQGIGTACNLSTATYPSTATGTGNILRADGTNWVASTATYPDTAGSSGNVLTSDGTNWSSSAPAGGNGFNWWFYAQSGNPADSTTYYLSPGRAFTTFTTAVSGTRIYVASAYTLNTVYGAFGVGGTLGSNENCTFFIRKNNTSNTNITTTLQLTSTFVSFNATSLGLSLVAGDYISFGFTGPAWGTNPTTVTASISWSS